MLPRIVQLTAFACLSLAVASAQRVEEPVLTLQEAIDQALASNLGLITERYTPANAIDDIEVEESAFDFELFGSTSLGKNEAAASGSSLDSADVPQSENRNAGAGVDKRFSTGATVTLDSNISRNTSNNNSVRNPDYSSDVGINLRQPLMKDAWSTINLAPIARARASAKESTFEFRSNVLDVLVDTEIAYWNLAFARAAHELIASNLTLAENLLEESRERNRLGLVTPLDVLQAETELVNQQEDLILSNRAIADAQDALRRAMGNASFSQTLDEELFVRQLPLDAPQLRPLASVVADTIASDSDAKAQAQRVEVQRINKLLADDQTRPDLDLVGRLRYLGRDDNGPDSHQGAFEGDGYDWRVGLEIRFPWSFREARARARQADRNLERSKVQLYDIKQEKALAARTAWRAVEAGRARLDVTGKALSLNLQSFEQERARYGEGLIPYRTVLEAQRDLDTARRNQLSAMIETKRAIARLSRVDGTILTRNGFSWENVDALAQPVALDSHPLLSTLEAN